MSKTPLKSDESRTKKFLKNSMSSFLYQAVLLISGFITPRIMLTCYGSQVNGLVSSVAQFVGYLALVEAGLSAATVYSLYKPLADRDNDAISSVVSAAKKFYYKSGWLFLGLICILALAYPFFINMPGGMNYLDVMLLVFISGVSGVIDFFTLGKYRALLTADQKTYVVGLAATCYTIVNVLIIAVLSYLRMDICVVKAVALLAVFLRSAIIVTYCRKKYPDVNYKAKPNYEAMSKRWDALFQQVLGVIQNGAPIIILTLIGRDLTAVSIFVVFNMIVAGLNSMLSIFISGLSASFGEVIAKGEERVLQKAYGEFETAYYLIISMVYTVAFFTIMSFVEIYTQGISDANYNQPILGFLFVLNGLLYNIKTPQGMLVLSAGMYRETRWRALIQALLILVVGVPLCYFWGILGVLIGLLVSNAYRAIDLMWFVPKKITKMSPMPTVKRWLIIGINIVLTYFVVGSFSFSPINYLQWVLLACIIGVITVGINLGTFFISCKKEIKALLARIRIIR